jgi:hypothetical protein
MAIRARSLSRLRSKKERIKERNGEGLEHEDETTTTPVRFEKFDKGRMAYWRCPYSELQREVSKRSMCKGKEKKATS